MILSAIIIVGVLFLVLNFVQCLITLKKSKLPALPVVLPLLGHTHYFIGSTHVFFEKLKDIAKIGSSFGLFIGPFFTPFLYDLNIVPHLIKSENHIQKKAQQYNFLRALGKRQIFVETGVPYKESKRVLLHAVSHANLREYFTSFNTIAQNFVDDLRSKVGGGEFNMEVELYFCIVSVLLDTIMGLDATIMSRDEIVLYAKEFTDSITHIFNRGFRIWLYPDFFYKFSSLYKMCNKSVAHTRKITGKLIIKRKQKFEAFKRNEENTTRTSVFIDKYFESKKDDGSEFSVEDITDDVLSLMGAGFETTVSSLGFIIMMLAINQDIQEKAFNELKEKQKNNKRYFTTEDLNELPYLDQVIQETWRLYPPIAFMGRQVTKDIDLPNGGHLKKGIDIWFFLAMLHRNPKYYPEPEIFNPDNFLPERVKERPPEVFMPFGFGTRKCFGNIFAKLVIKTTLCHLVTNYQFHTTTTVKDFRLAFEFAMKNKIGVPVSIKPREKI
ncbi:hypothetical protein HHI36_011137 [Cryptolaemus montrouzieri]|uniref:Cytochrome P450 n=1 Tax=Cryptolaemus montrouzieri TaxID=559131 RepID=A0ABD2ML63_9CUCU